MAQAEELIPVMWPQRPSQPPVCENLLGGLRAWRGASRGCGIGTKSPWGEGLPWGKQVVIVHKGSISGFPLELRMHMPGPTANKSHE